MFRLHWVIALSLAFPAASMQVSEAAESDAKVDFQKEIQPILAKRCFACHGPDEAEGGLSFASQESAFAETDSGGHAFVAGDSDASVVLERITSEDEFDRMPPEGDRVTADEIATIKRWIEQGAVWRDHWAFEPLSRPEPPRVEDKEWQANPIDAFIYASLQSAGLKPNPPEQRRALMRRVQFGLTGLPPTKEQADAFVADDRPDAFKQLCENLLASEHYGERWGRHWLDLVRFAETNSFERDGPKPNAWKYRDYVIRSFNEDKPYDQFVKEQLAGDELENVTTETLTATGYYRLGIWDDEPADPLQARFDGLDDIILTTGQVFLGLTLNCARCHDHKIDPIPQADYYSFLSFFEDLTQYGRRGDPLGYNQLDVSSQELRESYAANDRERIRLEKEIREIEQAGIAKMSAPDQRATEGPRRDRNRVLKQKLDRHLTPEQRTQYQDLKDQLAKNRDAFKQLPPREQVLGIARYRPIAEPTRILFRGSPHSPADEVRPAYPALFKQLPPRLSDAEPAEKASGRRRVLADWITTPDNRLTARVMVNRIWQYHFGRGLVRSGNNFGRLGTPPTHPELLDYLANRFVEEGWSIKAMHRLILSSRTYQMSSQANEAMLAADPENNLFWRFDPRRLSGEEVRDSLLAINGSLNRKSYGPSIYPQLSAEVLAGQSRPGSGWGNSSEADQNRRSVYIYVKRSLITPMLSAFDFPDPDLTCEARFMTLQPAQALSLLNGDFASMQATRMTAAIVEALGAELDDSMFVREVIQRSLARGATEEEIASGTRLINSFQTKHGLGETRARQLYALSVVNWNEFLFLD
ncbi:MAG: PSD1 and planctomycete cytochrome C domain-containing protein [Planctomycetota bacterium]